MLPHICEKRRWILALTIAVAVLVAFDLLVRADDGPTVWVPPTDFTTPLNTHADLGNITSTGHDGRQLFVEPADPSIPGPHYRFFPPHDILPDAYPDPTPDSLAQSSILLTPDVPLWVVIPQLAHFPLTAGVTVSHSIADHEITLNAAMHFYGSVTATIYGPHELLYPIGELPAGDYRLTLNLDRSSEVGFILPESETGYILFTIVPEPPSVMLMLSALIVGVAVLRRS